MKTRWGKWDRRAGRSCAVTSLLWQESNPYTQGRIRPSTSTQTRSWESILVSSQRMQLDLMLINVDMYCKFGGHASLSISSKGCESHTDSREQRYNGRLPKSHCTENSRVSERVKDNGRWKGTTCLFLIPGEITFSDMHWYMKSVREGKPIKCFMLAVLVLVFIKNRQNNGQSFL